MLTLNHTLFLLAITCPALSRTTAWYLKAAGACAITPVANRRKLKRRIRGFMIFDIGEFWFLIETSDINLLIFFQNYKKMTAIIKVTTASEFPFNVFDKVIRPDLYVPAFFF
jgi:hypothetical protein